MKIPEIRERFPIELKNRFCVLAKEQDVENHLATRICVLWKSENLRVIGILTVLTYSNNCDFDICDFSVMVKDNRLNKYFHIHCLLYTFIKKAPFFNIMCIV